MPHLNKSLWFIIGIALLPFILFWRWVLYGEVLFWGTPFFQFWPWHELAKRMALSGEWPLWNPLLGNGTPLLANLQTAFFYPPNLLYLFLPVAHGLTLSVILHLSLAGLLMYIYARQLQLSPFAATVSALTYMFSGYLVGRSQFVTMVNALAWFPLLLQLSERLTTRRHLSNIVWLGVIWAIQLLAGHAQLWFYGLWLVGAYTLFRLWQETSPCSPSQVVGLLLKGGLALGAALTLALLLAAVQILPTAELTTQSPRSSGADRHFALSYSLWPWRLITLLAPNFFGHPATGDYWGYATYWEDHAYIGVLPFLLALMAIWGYWRRSDSLAVHPSVVPFFAMLIPISLILAMGWNTPVYLWLFDYVPGFSYFQAPSRLLIWYTLSVTVLAGVGAQHFTMSKTSRKGWQRLLVICMGITVAGITGGLVLAGVNLTFLQATTTLGVMLTLSIGLLLMRPTGPPIEKEQGLKPPQPPRGESLAFFSSLWEGRGAVRDTQTSPVSALEIEKESGLFSREFRWQALVILFIVIDLFRAATTLLPLLPPTLFNQPIANAEVLTAEPGHNRYFADETFEQRIKFETYYRFEAFGPTEIAHWRGLKESLIPNFGVYADLPSANNDDPLVVGRWQRLTALIEENDEENDESDEALKARLLALMNVGYLIDAPSESIWPILHEDNHVAIQRVPEPLPRAYFVPRMRPATDEETAIAGLTASNFDSRQEVIIITGYKSDLADLRPEEPGSGSDELLTADVVPVTVTERGAHQVTLSLDAPTLGFVVLTDTFYPGWQATVNGKPKTIWPANLAFRAVAVEAGAQTIEFRYRPRSFTLGLGISLITLLVTISVSIILQRKTLCLF